MERVLYKTRLCNGKEAASQLCLHKKRKRKKKNLASTLTQRLSTYDERKESGREDRKVKWISLMLNQARFQQLFTQASAITQRTDSRNRQ